MTARRDDRSRTVLDALDEATRALTTAAMSITGPLRHRAIDTLAALDELRAEVERSAENSAH